MKAQIRNVTDGDKRYQCLAFICPGCESMGKTGLLMLPVNTIETSPSWDWDGNLEAPTLSPSILSYRDNPAWRCHSFLRNGKFEFLNDSAHAYAGMKDIPMLNLPDWFVEESSND